MTRMSAEALHREFKPGTTGWSIDDLDDPEIERLWTGGRFEMVEGVLAEMAAPYFNCGLALRSRRIVSFRVFGSADSA